MIRLNEQLTSFLLSHQDSLANNPFETPEPLEEDPEVNIFTTSSPPQRNFQQFPYYQLEVHLISGKDLLAKDAGGNEIFEGKSQNTAKLSD